MWVQRRVDLSAARGAQNARLPEIVERERHAQEAAGVLGAARGRRDQHAAEPHARPAQAFPLDGLSGLLAGGLLTVLPVGLVAWYPARALLGLDRAWAGFITPLAALVLGGPGRGMFAKGKQHYERTGSNRYRAMDTVD